MKQLNVLQLTNPDADHGAAFAYNGLRLNDHNVWDYPRKESYHAPVQEGGVWVGWMGGFSDPAERPEAKADEVKLLKERLKDGAFDLVILESPRAGCLAAFKELASAIKAGSVPVVLHDGEDTAAFPDEQIATVAPRAILKREVPKADGVVGYYGNALRLAFPFSGPDQLLDLTSGPNYGMRDDLDVFFLAGATHPDRQHVTDALRAAYPEGRRAVGISPDTTNAPDNLMTVSWHDFARKLSAAKVGVSCRGAGVDTCRYWEIPLSGAAMVCDEVDLAIPHPFEDGHTCWTYPFPGGAGEAVESLLAKGVAYRDLAKRGYDHAVEFHTNSARVRWMLETMGTEGVIDL